MDVCDRLPLRIERANVFKLINEKKKSTKKFLNIEAVLEKQRKYNLETFSKHTRLEEKVQS